MFIAKNGDLIVLVDETEEALVEKLQFMVYDTIEEVEETYVNYNGTYITEEEAHEKEEEEEMKRKAKLKMTKQDFFLYVLKPYNVTYGALTTLLSQPQFDTLKACYEGCNHIYRYDANFMGNIKVMLEALTQTEIDEEKLMAFLDQQFEEHNATD